MKTRAQIPSTANLKILEQEAKAIYIELFEINEIHTKQTSLFPSECVILSLHQRYILVYDNKKTYNRIFDA